MHCFIRLWMVVLLRLLLSWLLLLLLLLIAMMILLKREWFLVRSYRMRWMFWCAFMTRLSSHIWFGCSCRWRWIFSEYNSLEIGKWNHNNSNVVERSSDERVFYYILNSEPALLMNIWGFSISHTIPHPFYNLLVW